MTIATPALRFDFANAPRLLDPRGTFSRASVGKFTDPLGSLKSAPNNVPRWWCHPITGQAQGVLFEPSRTNLALQSEDFANASWTKTALSVTANSVMAPDGTTTADTLTATAANGTAQQGITITAGNAISASVFARAIASHLILSLTDGTNAVSWWFNLAAGTTGSNSAGGGNVLFSAKAIEAFPGGWVRCALTVTTSIATSFVAAIAPAAADSVGTANGDAIYAWGAQVEAPGAASASSTYIATAGTSVTRNADSLVIPTDSRWFNPSEGTLILEWVGRPAAIGGVFGGIGNTFSDTIYLTRPNTTQLQMQVGAGGTGQATILRSHTLAEGAITRAAMAWAANDFVLALDGAAPSTDTLGTVPSGIARLAVGGHPYAAVSASQCGMPIRRAAYVPRRLANSVLQTLTAP